MALGRYINLTASTRTELSKGMLIWVVSVTYPPNWTGQLLFNVSLSKPVNALVSTNITYNAALHPVDYPIDMPQGVGDLS